MEVWVTVGLQEQIKPLKEPECMKLNYKKYRELNSGRSVVVPRTSGHVGDIPCT